MLHDIDGSVRENPAVVGTAPAIIKSIGQKQARRNGVLAIASNVGKDIRDANHAALERHGTQMLNCVIARGNAILNRLIKLFKRAHVRKLKNTLFVLAVVAQHAIERLERHVAAVQSVEHTDRLHVMEKITPSALMIDIVEEALAGMAERRVSQVVTQANRLNQIAIEPQGATDIARNAGDKLHVQTSA